MRYYITNNQQEEIMEQAGEISNKSTPKPHIMQEAVYRHFCLDANCYISNSQVKELSYRPSTSVNVRAYIEFSILCLN